MGKQTFGSPFGGPFGGRFGPRSGAIFGPVLGPALGPFRAPFWSHSGTRFGPILVFGIILVPMYVGRDPEFVIAKVTS